MTKAASVADHAEECRKNASGVRADVWLWAARFFKTRSLAKDMIEKGRVLVNGDRVKPAKLVYIDSQLTITREQETFDVVVKGLSDQRGNAALAARLYHESPESSAKRMAQRDQLRLERAGYRAPAQKPDKQARRALHELKSSATDSIETPNAD